jgi:hypothetical protein
LSFQESQNIRLKEENMRLVAAKNIALKAEVDVLRKRIEDIGTLHTGLKLLTDKNVLLEEGRQC